MSSIVKKSSHFTPKARRRPLAAKAAPTPPASQAADAPTPPAPAASPQTLTPPPSQAPPAAHPSSGARRLSKYSLSQPAPAPAAEPPAQDPVSAAPPPPQPDSDRADSDLDIDNDSDAGYGDNDIFAAPPAARRRSSAATSRRLSGISALRRNSSISAAVAPAADDDAHAAPVPIGIPVAKPQRKRRSSVSQHGAPGRKAARSSVIAVPSASDVLAEEQDEGDGGDGGAGPGGARRTARAHSAARADADVVVGLDPHSGSLRLFRASAAVQGHAELPVAPADLERCISHISQIPRKIRPEYEQYFASVNVSAESVTMAELCKPTLPIGATSEKFRMAEEAKAKIAAKKAQRRAARALARRDRISYDDALRVVQGDVPPPAPRKLDLAAPAPEPATSSVKLNIVGNQIQVNTESTVVNRGMAHMAENREVEVENPFENPITSNSYTRSTHTDAWTQDEVIELYNALSTWGTDFTFIAQLFPYRTRRQVKRKYILEEKRNPQLVELALLRKLPPNFQAFCTSASATACFKSVEDFNREMADIRRDHEAHLEEINTERERAIKEDLEANRRREIEHRSGQKSMSRAQKIKQLRQNETVVGTVDDKSRLRAKIDA